MISTLIELLKAIDQFFRDRQTCRRIRWERIADHMAKVADALDGAAGAYKNGRAPYREYVKLQRYAVTFESVAREAFKGDGRDDQFTGFVAIIESSLN